MDQARSLFYLASMSTSEFDIAIIGGGASGFFAALTAAAQAPSKSVIILESSPRLLTKVRISGGGRCNVTHNQYDVQTFCQNYPRGSKELRSPFHRFHVSETVSWFEKRGVKLVSEEDGRMFPSTNSSETIVKCFLEEAQKLSVTIETKSPVKAIRVDNNGHFLLELSNDRSIKASSALIATGSSKKGYELAKALGHSITQLAPSLFSFKIKSPLLKELSGTSFQRPHLKLAIEGHKKSFQQSGPLLITHHGLSGPAVLKLSAWAAREMQAAGYKAKLTINWLGASNIEFTSQLLNSIKEKAKKSQIKNAGPDGLTNRFWKSLLDYCGIDAQRPWEQLSKKDLNRLSAGLYATELSVQGQNRFKEEFVECGGVDLKEVDLKSMQSKLTPGLYFSGEILDVDGITGGFNFQNAWTTGHLAGSSMAMQD